LKEYTYWVFYHCENQGRYNVCGTAVTLLNPIKALCDLNLISNQIEKELGFKNVTISHWTLLEKGE